MSKKCVRLTFALSALGIASVGWAQTPVQLNYTRVVDLSLPIESNMAGIPRTKDLRGKSVQGDRCRSHHRGSKGVIADRRHDVSQ